MKSLRLILTILAVVAVCLVLAIGGAFFWWTNIYIPRVRHNAEACWAKIGRPMPEFEKRLKRVEENGSLRALICDLEPFGVLTVYKARKGEQNPNTIRVPKEITDVLHPTNPRTADEIGIDLQNLAYMNDHVGDLDHLYQGILRRDPPVWSFVPQDGMTLRVASYLAARNVSQLICVDALHKIGNGHDKAACDAVEAGLKMTSNIGEQPILVSQMIRVAIEGLFAQVIARLPEDPGALQRLATDAEAKREMWRNAVQTETWAVTRMVDYLGLKPEEFTTIYRKKPLMRKVQISYTQSLLQGDCSFFITCVADQVRTSEHVKDLAAADLGVGEMRRANSRYAPILTPPSLTSFSNAFGQTWSRSWVRLNAVLLLREQAEVIRSVRTQVQAGASGSLGDRNSVVIPGARWQITCDVNNNSACLRLTPIPRWTSNEDVIGSNFFLLPLDGSKSWKFRTRQMQSQADHVASK